MKEFLFSGADVIELMSEAAKWGELPPGITIGSLGNSLQDVNIGGRMIPEITRCGKCIHFDWAEPPGCTLLDFSAGPDQAETGFCKWGMSKEDDL